MTLSQAQALLPGSQRVGDGEVQLLRVHSDTRTLRPGDLYVALRGERFDGHDFLAQAQASGAVAALASHGLGANLPGLLVPDTLLALQQLAAAHRQRCVLPLVAVVGSNGKTTVTQMVAAIFRAWQGDAALATAGNLNNHIGVPLTLLRLRPDPQPEGSPGHRAAVLELGMNHPGEIALLARLAAPTVVVVNNAQREHQEFMASVQAVAAENGSAINALGTDGVVVLPADDAHRPLWQQMAGQRQVLTFGLKPGADVHLNLQRGAARIDGAAGTAGTTRTAGTAISSLPQPLQLHTPAGTATTLLHLPGQHNLHNAAAAAAAALAAGAPLAAIAQGLSDFRPVAGRSQVLHLQRAGQPVTLVDDSYNANPDSVLAAIDVLAGLPGPRWLVLGDMGEVGSQGPQFHAEVGAHAQQRGIETVWAAGALCAHLGADRHFNHTQALVAALQQAPVAASVLVKGSRFMKMEQVVQALQQWWATPVAAAAPTGTGAACC